MLSYEFHPLAEAELDAAVGYYEGIQPGKGLELASRRRVRTAHAAVMNPPQLSLGYPELVEGPESSCVPFNTAAPQNHMTDTKTLYAEIKPDIEIVSSPLLEFSKQCLRDRGDFLPHAAVLTIQRKVELVGAKGEHDITNAAEILPLLHGGLRGLAKERMLSAIGVAESVTITPQGQATTRAIKILFEHRRGLTVALYLPYEKKILQGYVFGKMLSMLANPEIKAW